MLNHFITPENVFMAFLESEVMISKSGKTKKLVGPLKEVRGVGPVIVENAQALLRGAYPVLCEAQV